MLAYLFTCLYERVRMQEGVCPSTGSLPKGLRQPDLCRVDSKNQEFHAALPQEWQGPKFSFHNILMTFNF